MHRCGLSLGSNMGDRLACLRLAAEAVRLLADPAQPVLMSAVYETAPVGCAPGTASFYNAVMEISYAGDPESLLQRLRAVETAMGRPAERAKNDPRPIDLDLLYADDLVRGSAFLELPHPRLAERRFVLQPLAEIRPDLRLPGHDQPVRALLAALPGASHDLRLVTPDW
jgi:2-amino-4-hydroxy-6-hydroxymethyldihydropteridine diphosphokinase